MGRILAERLRACRMARRLSIRSAANRIGISRTTLWRLEEGLETQPTMETLERCANYYRVSVDYLRGIEEVLTKSSDYSPELAREWIRSAVHGKAFQAELRRRRTAGERLALVVETLLGRFGQVFSVPELARRLGTSEVALSDLVGARSNITARSDAFLKLVAEIGLPSRFFLTGDLGPMPELVEEVCALPGATEYLQAVKHAYTVGCSPKRLMALLSVFEVIDDPV